MQLHIATEQTIEILSNKELIAINQDPVVGTAITPFLGGINVCDTLISDVDLRFTDLHAPRCYLFSQPKLTYNDTHPSQYWSGRSENGTVFMLVSYQLLPAP